MEFWVSFPPHDRLKSENEDFPLVETTSPITSLGYRKTKRNQENYNYFLPDCIKYYSENTYLAAINTSFCCFGRLYGTKMYTHVLRTYFKTLYLHTILQGFYFIVHCFIWVRLRDNFIHLKNPYKKLFQRDTFQKLINLPTVQAI